MAAYLLYDGECGMCHRLVLFVMKRDRRQHFLFVPQQHLPKAILEARYGDTILVINEDMSVSSHSAAIIEILTWCSPFSRFLAWVLRCIPQTIRDFGYRLVARYRRRFIRKPANVCPLVPIEYRDRFPSALPLKIQQLFESGS